MAAEVASDGLNEVALSKAGGFFERVVLNKAFAKGVAVVVLVVLLASTGWDSPGAAGAHVVPATREVLIFFPSSDFAWA